MSERGSHPFLGLIKDMLPVLTAVVGALWGLFVYIDNENSARLQETRNAEAANRARLIEAQQPFLQKQLALYFETAKVLGDIASTHPDSAEWQAAERRFWALFWSELSMVETHAVEEAMVECGRALEEFKAARSDATRSALNNATYNVAHAIRDAIAGSWGSADALPASDSTTTK
jgi:hypothetical protein